MGLFDKVVSADPAGERNGRKPGKYWVMVNLVSKDDNKNPNSGHQGKEILKVHTVVTRVFESGCRSHGNTAGTPNPLCGGGHKPGEPCDFLFQDGIQGNEGRLKKFAMIASGTEDKNAISKNDLEAMIAPGQPLRGLTLEVYVEPDATITQKNKWIHRDSFVRLVPAEEVKRDYEKLTDAAKVELSRDNRLENQVAKEQKMKEIRAARAAAAPVAAAK